MAVQLICTAIMGILGPDQTKYPKTPYQTTHFFSSIPLAPLADCALLSSAPRRVISLATDFLISPDSHIVGLSFSKISDNPSINVTN